MKRRTAKRVAYIITNPRWLDWNPSTNDRHAPDPALLRKVIIEEIMKGDEHERIYANYDR